MILLSSMNKFNASKIAFVLVSLLCSGYFAVKSKNAEKKGEEYAQQYLAVSAEFKAHRFYTDLGIKNSDLTLNTLVHPDNYLEQPCEVFKSKTLFFRYSNRACQDCINQTLDSLKFYMQSGRLAHLVVIASFENFRQFFSRMTHGDNYFKEFSYYIPDDVCLLPCDTLNIPYFFTVDSTATRTASVFFPVKELPERTGDYLRITMGKLKK